MNTGRATSFSIQILQVIDALLIWAAFWIAHWLRGPVRDLLYGSGEVPTDLSDLSVLMFVIVPLAPIALESFGYYQDALYRSVWRSLWQIIRAGLVVALVVGLVVMFLKVPLESRWILGAAAPIAAGLLLLRERGTSLLVRQMVREEDAKEAVILVGKERERQAFLDAMPESFYERTKVVRQMMAVKGACQEELEAAIKEESVGKVIFDATGVDFDVLSEMLELCEVLGVEAWVVADFMQSRVARPTFDTMGGQGMLVLRSTPELSWALLAKGLMDRLGALILLILTSPLWLVAAVGIKLASRRGGILFFQTRAGRYGKPFKVWKFRTMAPDAEKQLEEVKRTAGNEMSGPVFKLHKDPRVFAWGSFLRKTSIDELPQLVNVLKGEMSLVGPRPLPMYEVENFDKASYRRRLSVKPGITCTWQAGGRNKITSFEEWVKLDLAYIDNWSLWLDIKILFKTVPAVLFGRGAK
ncbi:MAG: sugar transferase [Verrucomicrobiales bacterium]